MWWSTGLSRLALKGEGAGDLEPSSSMRSPWLHASTPDRNCWSTGVEDWKSGVLGGGEAGGGVCVCVWGGVESRVMYVGMRVFPTWVGNPVDAQLGDPVVGSGLAWLQTWRDGRVRG